MYHKTGAAVVHRMGFATDSGVSGSPRARRTIERPVRLRTDLERPCYLGEGQTASVLPSDGAGVNGLPDYQTGGSRSQNDPQPGQARARRASPIADARLEGLRSALDVANEPQWRWSTEWLWLSLRRAE